MLEEAIELIQQTAVRSETPVAVKEVALRNATLLYHNGTVHPYRHEPTARKHTICDLASLATLVNGHGEAKDGAAPSASIWHQGDLVVVVLNDAEDSFRDDRATWSLSPSEKFHCLLEEASKPRDQKPFVHFIVQNLRKEMEQAAPELLSKLRNLKFSLSDDQTGNIQQGRESMGRDIHAAVAGADQFPETVTFKVRRWANLDYVVPVECMLVVDVTAKKLALIPLADELQVAEDAAQDWLHATITDEVSAPVFYGTP